ncbi:hypothetical protein RHSIM_Rhsim13G0164300 [Rhododendron simsii]|uniref:non-specific serine/threonine protein kinase n=1 Tax=Rhododendron simsii TaxID=118357 RepID=A0A834G0Y9_RHOSS|nr:hypothetical protein RHSIM_Rhsim13G0164300 [Rhododendron simsii]
MSHDTKILCSIFLLLLQYQFQFCTPTDTINTTQSLKDGDLLISSNQTFALGFFTPGKSTNRYLGIWYYKVSEQTAVWVANRGDPINDTSGSLSFDVTGNLVVTGPDRSNPVWSTNVSYPTVAKNSSAQLRDSGNFVVLDSNGVVVWQSFDYPTNTLLPNLRFGVNRKTGLDRFLNSWKSGDDPGPGEYSLKMDLNGSPQLNLYKGSELYWRAGSWIGRRWSGLPEMTFKYIKDNYIENQDEVTLSYSFLDPSITSRLVVNESGTLQWWTWKDNEHSWVEIYAGPKKPCDSYNYCGPNGNCDPSNLGMGQFECTCLPGFEPKSASDWNLRDGSGGCVRKRGGHVCGSGEGFEKVPLAKVPNTWTAHVDRGLTGLKECESECLRNCSCNAYASANVSDGDSGCVTWHGDLMDTRVFSSAGQDLYIRVDAVELVSTTLSWEEGHGGSYSGLCYCGFTSHILLNLLVGGEEKKSGYMSPEYAMEGLFSVKSDVFSFGVLLLEIITGRKNISYILDNAVNLIGHVWSLWQEGRAVEIVGSWMTESDSDKEVLRCIHIALLCVEESANDRPNMSDVDFMLCDETALPPPKQPAFISKGAGNRPDMSSSASAGAVSINDVTLSAIQAR